MMVGFPYQFDFLSSSKLHTARKFWKVMQRKPAYPMMRNNLLRTMQRFTTCFNFQILALNWGWDIFRSNSKSWTVLSKFNLDVHEIWGIIT